jgi:hypothetical protein
MGVSLFSIGEELSVGDYSDRELEDISNDHLYVFLIQRLEQLNTL